MCFKDQQGKKYVQSGVVRSTRLPGSVLSGKYCKQKGHKHQVNYSVLKGTIRSEVFYLMGENGFSV